MSGRERLPYPGLRAYERDETDLFFGREGCVDDMVERLAANHFLGVLGASGSGKSSLVRTGLLDALELGFLAAAGPFWTIADCHPGSSPLRNLAAALLAARGGGVPEATDVEVFHAFLRRGPRSIVEWVKEGNLPAGHNLLLLIDQFEELFRYGDYAGREQAEAFSALLLESARGRIFVVITMRSEYLGACALIPGLAEQINKSLYLTRRMTREECRQAIEGPAKVAGFDIEPRLVARLLNDLSGFAPWDADRENSQLERLSRQADQLPLMQHALSRLWQLASERKSSSRPILTLQDYLDIGQLQGALDQHAEEVIARLSEAAKPFVGRVFRALVAGPGLAAAIRRPSRFEQLVIETGGTRGAIAEIVDAFRARGCNFLRPADDLPIADDTVIDISHESLIRQWQSLAIWFEEEAQSSALWDRLISGQERHAAGKGELLSGLDLATALDWWNRETPSVGWAASHGGRFEDVERFLRLSRENEEAYESAEKAREAEERQRQAAELKRAKKESKLRKAFAVTGFGLALLCFCGALVGWLLYDRLRTAQKNSANALVRVSEVIDRIQSSNVIGLTEIEKDLFDSLAPLQEYTLSEARYTLKEQDIVSLYHNYSISLAKIGDSQRATEKMATAFALSKLHLQSKLDPTQFDLSFITRFFEIVVVHSWSLMNAGDYDAAWRVLEFSAAIERAFSENANNSTILSALAAVENARARYFSDLDRDEPAYEAQMRAVKLQEKASGSGENNFSEHRSLITYYGNLILKTRALASSIRFSDLDRKTLLTDAANKSELKRCNMIYNLMDRNNLDFLFYGDFASCILITDNNPSESDSLEDISEKIRLSLLNVEKFQHIDPDLQDLQISKLSILDKLFRVEDRKSVERIRYVSANRPDGNQKGFYYEQKSILTEELKESMNRLISQWTSIIVNKTTLPHDVWMISGVYNTITDFLKKDEVTPAERESIYRLIRDALAPSLKAFPGAKPYQLISSDAAYQLAEVLRKRGDADDEALELYDEALRQFEKIGLFENFKKPSERYASACGAYSGKIYIYKSRKDATRALENYRELFSRCAPIVNRHDWDFYLRETLQAGGQVGALLFELGQYETARPLLEYSSHWADADATRLLSQIYRSGLGVGKDVKRADELAVLASRQSTKRFTVPADFNGTKQPFRVFVREWPHDFGYTGIDDQARWLEEYRGGRVPDDVKEVFRNLHSFAKSEDKSFPYVAIYSIGTADAPLPDEIAKEKIAKGFAPNPAISQDADGVAIGGLDPVSYFDSNGPLVGSEHFFAIWNGAVWFFVSAEHRDRFLKEPENYAPEFGGFCAECLAQGHKIHSVPTVWAIHGGRLHLYVNAALRNVWKENTEERLAAARIAWYMMSNKAISPLPSSRTNRYFGSEKEGREKLDEASKAILEKDYFISLTLLNEASKLLRYALNQPTYEGDRRRSAEYRENLIVAYGNVAFQSLFTKQDVVALEAADRALELDSHADWIRGNRAHALMFLGRVDEARSIYRLGRGAAIQGFDTFEDALRDDFNKLRAAGRTHPLMDEMAAAMGFDIDPPTNASENR
jgi:tetratricopeptide (TPR) repeat protein